MMNAHTARLRLVFTTAFAITLSILLAACGSQTTVDSDLGISGAPDWVNEGTQAVDNQKGKFLHGVGMAPAMGDSSLQKTTADNRARAEIAQILQSYIDQTVSDYTASSGSSADTTNTGANNSTNNSASMAISRELRTTTQLALSGAKILGHWKDKKTGDIYAFAELELESIDDMISKAAGLSAAFKDFYENNHQASFEQIRQMHSIPSQ